MHQDTHSVAASQAKSLSDDSWCTERHERHRDSEQQRPRQAQQARWQNICFIWSQASISVCFFRLLVCPCVCQMYMLWTPAWQCGKGRHMLQPHLVPHLHSMQLLLIHPTAHQSVSWTMLWCRYEGRIVQQMIINDGGQGHFEESTPPMLGIWDTLLAVSSPSCSDTCD